MPHFVTYHNLQHKETFWLVIILLFWEYYFDYFLNQNFWGLDGLSRLLWGRPRPSEHNTEPETKISRPETSIIVVDIHLQRMPNMNQFMNHDCKVLQHMYLLIRPVKLDVEFPVHHPLYNLRPAFEFVKILRKFIILKKQHKAFLSIWYKWESHTTRLNHLSSSNMYCKI